MLAAKLRGTKPFHGGQFDSQRTSLRGSNSIPTSSVESIHLQTFLFGRGKLEYKSGGYAVSFQATSYTNSASTLISPGASVGLGASDRSSFGLDVQFQHWDTPVTTSGSFYARALTCSAVYRFDFNHRSYDQIR